MKNVEFDFNTPTVLTVYLIEISIILCFWKELKIIEGNKKDKEIKSVLKSVFTFYIFT